MPVLTAPPTYGSRNVIEWMSMAAEGSVQLPNFQRSYVWRPEQTRPYLKALLENRPTGTFLTLKAADPPQFASRRLRGVGDSREGDPAAESKPRELVLDGQQRLTSLWIALVGEPPDSGLTPHRYFIRVRNLGQSDLHVEAVDSQAGPGDTPPKLFAANRIPTDILWNDRAQFHPDGEPTSSDLIWDWCEDADAPDMQRLYRDILKIRERLLVLPDLRYCRLSDETDADTAIDIFINVNLSSIKLRPVEIAVALAEGQYKEDFRKRCDTYLSRSAEAKYYFNPVREKAVTDVAERMLKVGCLRLSTSDHPDGAVPKETHYRKAVHCLFGPDPNGGGTGVAAGDAHIARLEEDLDRALRFVAARGGTTLKTLPAWPPVYVIAALGADIGRVPESRRGELDQLLSAYVWRAFGSERYATQANDRLWEDFRGLRWFVRAMATDARLRDMPRDRRPPIFDDEEYPVWGLDELMKAGWISSSRPGRTISAVVSAGKPRDWLTGERIEPATARELEANGSLHRHRVFPSRLLKRMDKAKQNRGLNGVLLSNTSAQLKRDDPAGLLEAVAKVDPRVDEIELRERLSTHLVSYPEFANPDALGYRYHRFCQERAKQIAGKLRKLTAFHPGT